MANKDFLSNLLKIILNNIETPAYAEQISPNFRREEFNQPREPLPIDQVMVDPNLIKRLEFFRSLAGNKPVNITSGYRSPLYNAETSGASPNSQHKFGRAADFKVNGLSPYEMQELAKQAGFNWTKTYPNRIHADVGKNPRPDLSPIKNIPMYSYILKTNKDKNFVDRLFNPDKYPDIKNPDGTYSTMKMRSSDNIAYPTIVYNEKTKKLKELSPKEAYAYAISTGEYIEFPSEEEANDFAANGYKKAFPKNYFNRKKR